MRLNLSSFLPDLPSILLVVRPLCNDVFGVQPLGCLSVPINKLKFELQTVTRQNNVDGPLAHVGGVEASARCLNPSDLPRILTLADHRAAKDTRYTAGEAPPHCRNLAQ